MSEMGKLMAADTLRFERVLPGPIEEVWAYLTESEKRKKWLAAGEMDLRVGGEIEFYFDERALESEADQAPEKYRQYAGGHRAKAHVLEVEAPRVLEITWAEGEVYESTVRFELFERGEEVLVVLTHRGLKGREPMLGVLGGWHTHLDIWVDMLAGRKAKAFWKAHLEWEARYEALLR